MKSALIAGVVLAGLVIVWWVRSSGAQDLLQVRVGQMAPDFTLRDQNGMPVTLSEFQGRHTVVLYFYPKDDTPGCTKEACSFRDDIARFQGLNVQVLGVSLDGLEAHRRFADKYRLNFPILSDADHRVSRAYGVLAQLAGFSYAKRTTFVIGEDGVIRRIFTDVNPGDHAAELLTYLRNIASTPAEGHERETDPAAHTSTQG